MTYFKTMFTMANALKTTALPDLQNEEMQSIPCLHAARVTPLILLGLNNLGTETSLILIQTTSTCSTPTVHAMLHLSIALQLKMERSATSKLQKKCANFLHLSCCKMPQFGPVLPMMQDHNQRPSTWTPLLTRFVLHSREGSRTSARAWI
jgi:hypothetical protein